jgi:hypothetical protein
MALVDHLVGIAAILTLLLITLIWPFAPAFAQLCFKRWILALIVLLTVPRATVAVFASMSPLEVFTLLAVIGVTAYGFREARRRGDEHQQSRQRGAERSPLLPRDRQEH